MPKGIRQDYSKELKLAAVYLMKSKKFRPKEVFEMLGGLDRQTVYRWVQEYDKKGESAFSGTAVLPGTELAQIKKENKELKDEVCILKKASAYFAEINKKR